MDPSSGARTSRRRSRGTAEGTVRASARAILERPHPPAEARAQGGETGVEIGAARAAEVHDRVAVARAVLVLLEVGELLAHRALGPDERAGEGGLRRRDLRGLGRREHPALLEDAQREARRGGEGALAAARPRPLAEGERERHLVAARAIDLLVEVGELAAEARVHLDDRDAVRRGIPGHLDVPERTLEAELADGAASDVGHARLHGLGERRGIVEAHEALRRGIDPRVDDAEDLDLSVATPALDGGGAPADQLLRDEEAAVELEGREA